MRECGPLRALQQRRLHALQTGVDIGVAVSATPQQALCIMKRLQYSVGVADLVKDDWDHWARFGRTATQVCPRLCQLAPGLCPRGHRSVSPRLWIPGFCPQCSTGSHKWYTHRPRRSLTAVSYSRATAALSPSPAHSLSNAGSLPESWEYPTIACIGTWHKGCGAKAQASPLCVPIHDALPHTIAAARLSTTTAQSVCEYRAPMVVQQFVLYRYSCCTQRSRRTCPVPPGVPGPG